MRSACRHVALLALASAIAATSCSEADAATTGPSIVRLVVQKERIREGDLFTVEVRGRRMKKAAAVAFHLVYDPALVVPVMSGVAEGTVLSRGGAPTSFLTRAASTADRVLIGIARLTSEGSARGKGLLCRLTFRAVGAGTASLVFDRAQVSDASAGSLPADFRPLSVRIHPGPGASGRSTP